MTEKEAIRKERIANKLAEWNLSSKREGDTLDDIAARDNDNLTHILMKEVKSYTVSGFDACRRMVGEAYRSAMKRVGIDLDAAFIALKKNIDATDGVILQKFLPDRVDELCKKERVHVEFRRAENYEPSERWKAGIYIYKNDEIAYVILDPIASRLVISPNGDKVFTLKTNAPIDGGKIMVTVH